MMTASSTSTSVEAFSVKCAPSATDCKNEENGGISVMFAALFVLGALAGAGIMAMPNAFVKAGWWALPLVTLMSAIGCMTALQLSWSWTILQENWREYSEHTRNPYPEIAFRAGGQWMKFSIQACVNLSMFGAAIAFLILSAQNIANLLEDSLQININFCYMICIVAVCMLPFSFLGTPKDFWPIALGAIVATVMAIILILIGTYKDMDKCRGKVEYPGPKFTGLVSAYCTICFSYGGHTAFPTIQHDMKRPARFPISVIVSFIVLFLMYLPMPIMAYMVYGNTVQSTIDLNLSSKLIRDLIMILITGHVLFAFFIVISPVTQDLERVLRVPIEFCWQRVCTRTLMMGLALFIGMSLPDFNGVMELVGGTCLAAGAYIFPGPIYLMLRKKAHEKQESANVEMPPPNKIQFMRQSSILSHKSKNGPYIPAWEYILNGFVVLLGILGALVTIRNVLVSGTSLKSPCYLSHMHVEHKFVASDSGHSNLTHCWLPSDSFYINASHI